MFLSSSTLVAVTLLFIGLNWISQIIDVVKTDRHAKDAIDSWVSPQAQDCTAQECEVPSEWGPVRRLIHELVVADNYKLDLVLTIVVVLYACGVVWCCWCQRRGRKGRVRRRVVGYHMPSPTRRSLVCEFLCEPRVVA